MKGTRNPRGLRRRLRRQEQTLRSAGWRPTLWEFVLLLASIALMALAVYLTFRGEP